MFVFIAVSRCEANLVSVERKDKTVSELLGMLRLKATELYFKTDATAEY